MPKPTPTTLFGKQYHYVELRGQIALAACAPDQSGRCIVCGEAAAR